MEDFQCLIEPLDGRCEANLNWRGNDVHDGFGQTLARCKTVNLS
jgi:hypothetical protein